MKSDPTCSEELSTSVENSLHHITLGAFFAPDDFYNKNARLSDMNKQIFVTIDHLDDFLGRECFRTGDHLILKKDRNNDVDDESIAVYNKNNIRCGYVANSVCTVARGTYSAGRIYDLFDEETSCIVRFITEDLLIAEADV